jgi:hypothetical protein
MVLNSATIHRIYKKHLKLKTMAQAGGKKDHWRVPPENKRDQRMLVIIEVIVEQLETLKQWEVGILEGQQWKRQT